jgi:hypothetical protein
LPPSDNHVLLLDDVRSELAALEALCGEVERGMMARRWDQLGTVLAESRRVRHALQNAMDAARDARDERFDTEIFQRLRYLYAVRENQIARLRTYQHSVRERLSLIARWKNAARTLGSHGRKSKLGTLDRLS